MRLVRHLGDILFFKEKNMELDEDFESYKATKNVIKRLIFWKEELEEQLRKFPKDATIYGQISEI